MVERYVDAIFFGTHWKTFVLLYAQLIYIICVPIVYILFIIGFVLLIKWADLLIDGSSALVRKFHSSDIIIWLTIVAFGMSVPELATLIVAFMKKESDIAIGNIIGSNIFNVLRVLWISSTIGPIAQSPTTNRDILFTLFISALLFLFVFLGKKYVLQKYQWLILVLLYVAYICVILIVSL